MDAKERREQLLKLLKMDIKPMSATSLADRFGVSRQIIVGDIALLRAAGTDILATPRGYLLNKKDEIVEDNTDSYVVVCRHDKVQLEDELYVVVDNGGILLNVVVDHPIYGSIKEELNIKSRYDADNFIAKVAMTGASLLSSLSDGIHMHTIRCPDPESYRRILVGLKEKRLLYTK